MNFYQKASYLLSAHTLNQLPPDNGKEVAFAGRSNAGKSSAINALTQQRSLARTSKTPGRTQQIIFFQLDDTRRLVDLPGYGFAKVPLSIKLHWQKNLQDYLNTRDSLCGLVLLMDIRHALTEFDQQMLHWCYTSHMPVHVLLTKADKLSYGKGTTSLQQVKKRISTDFPGDIQVQLFSALKWTGIEELKSRLNHWLEFGTTTSQ